jgi:hypothetical protein
MSEYIGAGRISPHASDARTPGPDAGRELALTVRLTEEGADAERLEQLTGALRLELLDLGVEDARPAREGRAPEGTKAGSAMDLGTLLVTLLGSPLLVEAVRLVEGWVKREHSRSATLTYGERTLTVNGISRGDQRRMIDQFIAGAGN